MAALDVRPAPRPFNLRRSPLPETPARKPDPRTCFEPTARVAALERNRRFRTTFTDVRTRAGVKRVHARPQRPPFPLVKAPTRRSADF